VHFEALPTMAKTTASASELLENDQTQLADITFSCLLRTYAFPL